MQKDFILKISAVILVISLLISCFSSCKGKKIKSNTLSKRNSSISSQKKDETDDSQNDDKPSLDDGSQEDFPDEDDYDFYDEDGSLDNDYVVEDKEEDDTLPEEVRDNNDYGLFQNGEGASIRLAVESDTSSPVNNLRVVFSEKGRGTFRFKDTDFLEYDVLMTGNSIGTGAVDVEVANGSAKLSNSTNAYDMKGLNAGTNSNLGSNATNKWYHRVIPITENLVGKSVFRWSLLQSNKINGETTVTYFKNIKIVDNKGKERFKIEENALTLMNIAAENNGIRNYSIKMSQPYDKKITAQGDFLRFKVANEQLSKNQSSYIAYQFSINGKGKYKIKKGDMLIYKVRCTDPFTMGSGSVDVRFTDKTWMSSTKTLKDIVGKTVYPSGDIRSESGAKWYYRVVKFPNLMVGKTVNYFVFKSLNNASSSEYETHIADVKIINNDKTSLLIYGGGKLKKSGLVAARNATVSVSRNQTSTNIGSPSGDYLKSTVYAESVTKVSTAIRFSSDTYTIQPGDCIEYDITSFDDVLPNSGFGVDLEVSGNEEMRFSGWKDQNAITGSVGYDLSQYTAGNWYHRKLNLGNSSGKTITGYLMAGELASQESIGINGRYYNFGIDNVVITNNGNIVKTIYVNGIPKVNTLTKRASNTMAVMSSTPYSTPTSLNKVFPTSYTDSNFVVTYNVKNFGAVGDGVTNDANAFQSAIYAVQSLGGGVVYAPEGKYVLRSNLYIPSSVCLAGDWKSPLDGGAGKGTILMCYYGKGNASDYSFLGVQEGGALKNFSVWYPEQNYQNPIEYPWTIQNYQENMNIKNLTLYNSYKALKAGPRSTGIILAENIFATALSKGIEIDCNFDTPRFINWTFDPSIWSNSGLLGSPSVSSIQNLKKYLVNNFEAIRVGRVDFLELYNITVNYAKTGIIYDKASEIESNTITTAGAFSNASKIKLLNTNTGIQLNCMSQIGLGVSSGIITANQGNNPAAIRTGSNFNVNAGFDDMTLSSTSDIVSINTNCTITLQNCKFSDWGTNSYAVNNKSGTVSVADCTFNKKNNHINIPNGSNGGTINGNVFSGTPVIKVGSSVNSKTSINNTVKSYADSSSSSIYTFRKEPTAGTNNVYLVTHYGAKCDGVTDDTNAIQEAINAAASAGGGIVYFPAAHYCVKGALTVKTGVQLCGVHEGSHHSMTAASIIELYTGKGKEKGTAAITLLDKAGIKGLDFYYPEQYSWHIIPYSWTLRSHGTETYAINCTFVNSYQGLDFGTYNSDKHYISGIGGAFIKTGIFIGNSPSYGNVQYTQLIMHYWTSYVAYGCTPQNTLNTFETLVYKQQAKQLTSYRFGDCKNESLLSTFAWVSNIGMQFIDQGKGGFKGEFIIPGVDGSFINLDVKQCESLDIVSPFLYVHGLTGYSNFRTYMHTHSSNTGTVRIFNACAGENSFPTEGFILENGATLLQQFNFAASADNVNIKAIGGDVILNSIMARPASLVYPHTGQSKDISIGSGVSSLNVNGWVSINRGDFNIENLIGNKYHNLGIISID